MVNELIFPKPDAVIFVGTTEDPKDSKTKAEPDLGIKEYDLHRAGDLHAQGGGVAEGRGRPGDREAHRVQAQRLRQEQLLPAEGRPGRGQLKVLDGPAVAVEKAYAEEVKKALAK